MKVDSVVVLHSITNDLLLSLSGRQRKKQRKRSAAKAPLPGPVPPRRPLQGFGVASSAPRTCGAAGPSPSPPVAGGASLLFEDFCQYFRLTPFTPPAPF